MRLERGLAIERGDIADTPAPYGRHRSDRDGVRPPFSAPELSHPLVPQA